MQRSTPHDPALRPGSAVEVDARGRIRTERLLIRPLDEGDRNAFIALVRSNADRLAGRIPLHEQGETDDAFFDRQLDTTRRTDADRTAMRRVAVLSDGSELTGSLVGCFNLNSITRGLAWEADAAWWVDHARAGRGLATEGVRALLQHAFDPLPAGLGLHSVHCGIEHGNAASRRVAERCGFRHQPGRQSYLKIGTSWVMHEFHLATPETPAGAEPLSRRPA